MSYSVPIMHQYYLVQYSPVRYVILRYVTLCSVIYASTTFSLQPSGVWKPSTLNPPRTSSWSVSEDTSSNSCKTNSLTRPFAQHSWNTCLATPSHFELAGNSVLQAFRNIPVIELSIWMPASDSDSDDRRSFRMPRATWKAANFSSEFPSVLAHASSTK